MGNFCIFQNSEIRASAGFPGKIIITPLSKILVNSDRSGSESPLQAQLRRGPRKNRVIYSFF